ncbi:MAG: extracellular solute-binding protein [Dehalococcoidia bacterium]|nr:extracellular solute-binding protein [Dehalococcoidia bacterium]
MSDFSRRGFIHISAVSGAAAALAACAPAAAPAAPPAPASSAPSAPAPAWQREWDDLVAAAKKEGQLVLICQQQSEGFRKAFDAFEKTFPGVTIEAQGYASSSLVMPKIQQEQKAGIYAYDVIQHSIQSFLTNLKPTGAFAPLAPVICRPDVLDDKSWADGFQTGFVDSDNLVYMFGWYSSKWAVNTDLVKEGEIKSIKDLLDAKWSKGKIGMVDVRSGSTFTIMLAVKQNLGEETVKKLIVDQAPLFHRDERIITEQLLRGQIAVTNARVHAFIQDFRDQGLGKNVKSIDLPESRSALTGSGLWLMKNAPHPNAAKLFINWLLTKEGQDAWKPTGIGNSRRVDVTPFDPESVIEKGGKYLIVAREDMLKPQDDMVKYLSDLLK